MNKKDEWITRAVHSNVSSSVFLHSGSFGSKFELSVGGRSYGVAIGDLDGDGKSEVVASNYSGGSVTVFKNNSSSGSLGSSSFGAGVSFSSGGAPWGVSLSDMDGDGKLDIVLANYGQGSVTVLRNKSSGGVIDFDPKVDLVW